MAGNFIGMVFGWLKEHGVDTSNLSVQEAVEKYNEMNGEQSEKETIEDEVQIKDKIQSLQEKMKKMSLFSPERRELFEEVKKLEEKIKSKNEIKQKPKTQINLTYEIKEKQKIEVTPHKENQFKIIQQTNPMMDDTHTGIRSASDIKSPQEAFGDMEDEKYSYPDFTEQDGEKALKTGKITIYSSKPIKQGGFVSPSKMMAQDYAGSGQVYSAEVNINDIAWINGDEGQFAKV